MERLLLKNEWILRESGNVQILPEVDEIPVKFLPEGFTRGGSNDTKINPNFSRKF
jgi:hypothetical protein